MNHLREVKANTYLCHQMAAPLRPWKMVLVEHLVLGPKKQTFIQYHSHYSFTHSYQQLISFYFTHSFLEIEYIKQKLIICDKHLQHCLCICVKHFWQNVDIRNKYKDTNMVVHHLIWGVLFAYCLQEHMNEFVYFAGDWKRLCRLFTNVRMGQAKYRPKIKAQNKNLSRLGVNLLYSQRIACKSTV